MARGAFVAVCWEALMVAGHDWSYVCVRVIGCVCCCQHMSSVLHVAGNSMSAYNF